MPALVRRGLRPLLVLTFIVGVLSGCWPSVGTDFADPGPYEDVSVLTETDHTFFYPTDLRDDGVKHPVILWGNGTFLNPTHYQGLLEHFASHGFIVAAANTTNAGSGTEMIAGLDRLAGLDATPGNAFFDKVDLTKIATMGHSQGGGGAINAARDPRVTTVVPIQPWLGDDNNLRGTVFFLAGSADTVISSASVRQKYDGVQSRLPAAYGDLTGADHFQPIGTGNAYRGHLTAWVRWQLMGDDIAGHQFVGDCVYCGNPLWSTYETNPQLEATAPDPLDD
jgi:predicted dienelactone hydrolase